MIGFDPMFEQLMTRIAKQIWDEWGNAHNEYLSVNLEILHYPTRQRQQVVLDRDFNFKFSNN